MSIELHPCSEAASKRVARSGGCTLRSSGEVTSSFSCLPGSRREVLRKAAPELRRVLGGRFNNSYNFGCKTGVQFNRHLKFKAWIKAWVKDKVKDAFRKVPDRAMVKAWVKAVKNVF